MRESLEKLNTLINNERSAGSGTYSLENMKQLLEHFGDPQKSLTIVHVAGTNGKGSVCHMLHAILTAARLQVGLYTSPHLESVRERIALGGACISEAAFSRYTGELFDLLAERADLAPTYFDALTLIALRYFSDEKADIAIMETGLGGRLDSTNAADSIIAVITDIAMDHGHILGDNLASIAAEKAGIIKPGSITITSNRNPEVLAVIEAQARKAGSRLMIYGRDFRGGDITPGPESGLRFNYSIQTPEYVSITGLTIQSPVRAQVRNASLAVTAAMILNTRRFTVSREALRAGLGGLRVPGRYQILSRSPLIIFDPAHNPEAILELVRTLHEQYPGKNFIAVLSFMRDKEYSSMIQIIQESLTQDILYYELFDPRGVPGKAIQQESGTDIPVTASAEDLQRHFKNAGENDSVVIATGSFRLYSAVRNAAEMAGDARSAGDATA